MKTRQISKNCWL